MGTSYLDRRCDGLARSAGCFFCCFGFLLVDFFLFFQIARERKGWEIDGFSCRRVFFWLLFGGTTRIYEVSWELTRGGGGGGVRLLKVSLVG